VELAAAVELCSTTLATPSIRRRRLIVLATTDCEVAQPWTVNVGTLPAGVADVTDPLPEAPGAPVAAAAGPLAELEDEVDEEDADEDEEEEEEDDEDEEEPPAGPAPVPVPVGPPLPTAPLSDEIEASFGSTRANSWKACAQSKRELASSSTAATRCLRIDTKAV
jgi:hypothetical protein